MNKAILSMLARYNCVSTNDYENALKEIIQEISLLGLWRGKFFEKAAFYGGTALRIFYGLERFSEDMDFSLTKLDKQFNIGKYCSWITDELKSFGFEAEVEKKSKVVDSAIQSAFVKAGTIQNLLEIEAPKELLKRIPSNKTIKIKIEIDIDPPLGFSTEAKYLLQPIPFSVNLYSLPDLFAGKMHAILCREWKGRTKGRDWYDLVWYVGRGVLLNLSHLEKRMRQTGHVAEGESFSREVLLDRLQKKIEQTDFEAAKNDVMPMLKDTAGLNVWSKEFFSEIVRKINLGIR